jgi:curved DNA-binding protein CbpA
LWARPAKRGAQSLLAQTEFLGQKHRPEIMVSARSLYEVLNVSRDAEIVVIEAAYRALMKKYHPDQASGRSEGNMSAAEINQAFAILRDPKRRAGYDRHERIEWIRNQPVHIAQPAVQPPQRRSGFAWTGWLVALLLGAILYAVLNGRGGLIVPPSPGNESSTAELDHRTQPVSASPSLEELTAPTALDREILLSEAKAEAARHGREAIDRAEAQYKALDGDPAPVIIDPETAPAPERARSANSRSRARAPQRERRPGTRSRQDEDFHKREGYIY